LKYKYLVFFSKKRFIKSVIPYPKIIKKKEKTSRNGNFVYAITSPARKAKRNDREKFIRKIRL